MSLRELHAKLIDSGCNLNDQAITLIEACIESGIDRGPAIVRAMSELGLNKASVGAQLKHNCAKSPDRCQWFKAEDGRYRLHT